MLGMRSTMLLRRALAGRPRCFPPSLAVHYSTPSEENPPKENIFARGRNMAKKYFWTYSITYSTLTAVSIGGIFAALQYQYIDSVLVHGLVVHACDFAEGVVGYNETLATMRANPELGTNGNLALALVADTFMGPVKLMTTVPIVTSIVKRRQKRE